MMKYVNFFRSKKFLHRVLQPLCQKKRSTYKKETYVHAAHKKTPVQKTSTKMWQKNLTHYQLKKLACPKKRQRTKLVIFKCAKPMRILKGCLK